MQAEDDAALGRAGYGVLATAGAIALGIPSLNSIKTEIGDTVLLAFTTALGLTWACTAILGWTLARTDKMRTGISSVMTPFTPIQLHLAMRLLTGVALAATAWRLNSTGMKVAAWAGFGVVVMSFLAWDLLRQVKWNTTQVVPPRPHRRWHGIFVPHRSVFYLYLFSGPVLGGALTVYWTTGFRTDFPLGDKVLVLASMTGTLLALQFSVAMIGRLNFWLKHKLIDLRRQVAAGSLSAAEIERAYMGIYDWTSLLRDTFAAGQRNHIRQHRCLSVCERDGQPLPGQNAPREVGIVLGKSRIS